MLEEAVEVIRALWQGGVQSHRGRHYRVENARIYDLPEQLPPILVSGFGPKATEPRREDRRRVLHRRTRRAAVKRFREAGGGQRSSRAG